MNSALKKQENKTTEEENKPPQNQDSKAKDQTVEGKQA